MSYLDYLIEDQWQKRSFDKLASVEEELDHLLVLREQAKAVAVQLPLKPEYLDIVNVSRFLNDDQETIYKRVCG